MKNILLKKIASEFSILVIEDDIELSKNIEEVLENFFKNISTSLNGLEGLYKYIDYFEKNKSFFDIVLTDIQMPHMNGIDLSKEILKINKNQKIIVMSAYDDKKYLIELINISISGFIQKPFSDNQNLDVLYKVCMELEEDEKKTSRYIDLGSGFYWNNDKKSLYDNNKELLLTNIEVKLMSLLLSDTNRRFNPYEIFEYIHESTEKEFSNNSLRSTIKRLRKKLPEDTISNIKDIGYSIKHY